MRQLCPQLRIPSLRLASTIAWGQNDDFRCGVAGQPVITQPTVVSSGTSDFQVVQPRAGRTHSAAIDTAGQVLVWGSGSHGKLGHASSRSVDSPLALSQLPSLCQAACGHQHTLLLDRQGSVWSCGENKEGQCGIGTSFEDIAMQRRQEWSQGVMLHKERMASSQHASPSSPAQDPQSTVSQRMPRHTSRQPADLPQHAERQQELRDVQRLMQERVQGQTAAASTASEDPFALKPGQIGTPVRLDTTGTGTDPGSVGPVTQVAASRFFSMLLAASGRVYGFGAGYNGELGPDHAWSTSPKPIGPLQQLLDKEGGACQVAAGSTFTLCLTRQGRVGVLGRVPGEPALGQQLLTSPQGTPFTSVAAGHKHAVLTDGRRVWTAGRYLSAQGQQQLGTPWGADLQQHLDLGSQRVAAVAAGAHCCAALSETGQLFFWGHLLSQDMVQRLRQCEEVPHAADLWPGLLGADEPVRLAVENVQAVSIGATHILALVS